MNQTLIKIKNLFALKEIAQPISTNNSKPHLAPVLLQKVIPSKEIAERAFMIWQERGCSHGNDYEDWVLARIQLEDELN